MQVLAANVAGHLEKASWIRKMFEAGREMKNKYGEENVQDFSLGNPDIPPPKGIGQGLKDLAEKAESPFVFGYMPNNGYPQVRETLADKLTQEQGVQVQGKDVIMTCGAAGGLNALFRTVLEPGEQVVCPAPYFVEYTFYAQNHNGELLPVPSKPLDFSLDLQGLEAAITDKTRIVLLNSPNNPTGQVYSAEELGSLAEILDRKSKEQGRPIFLVSDEPYRFLTYDDVQVPSILPLYEYSLVVSSFSKSHSLAGERVGYLLLNPDMPKQNELLDGLIFANRILGFVNAPAIGQLLIKGTLEEGVEVDIYKKRRDCMAEILNDAGYTFSLPKGGFYFFVQAPTGDDLQFVHKLQEEKILAVPGSGFGFPGYFRLSFCVGEDVIQRAREGFRRAIKAV
jgi:aspartate aminotransferase